jgi:hypothetical protein
MTIVILDRPGGQLHPYPKWLADSGEELALFTGRSKGDIFARERFGYSKVYSFADYPTTAAVERGVLGFAERTAISPISAVVAVDAGDLVRAGALRDRLVVPGQTREAATVLKDLVLIRRRLERAGIPAPIGGPVQRVADLYWYAHRWGYPLRIRRRRSPGWPETAVLTNEAAVRAFTREGLAPDLEVIPSLVAERCLEGPRMRVAAIPDDDGSWLLRRSGWLGVAAVPPDAAVPDDLADLVRSALEVLSPSRDALHLVEAVRGATGQWLVESVACGLSDRRSDVLYGTVHGSSVYRVAARVQAGLPNRGVRGMVA